MTPVSVRHTVGPIGPRERVSARSVGLKNLTVAGSTSYNYQRAQSALFVSHIRKKNDAVSDVPGLPERPEQHSRGLRRTEGMVLA
jgi:hypothetical protein